ncbi:hypothetical protein XANCAGTX0491_010010 [Xanthoria calcicola]
MQPTLVLRTFDNLGSLSKVGLAVNQGEHYRRPVEPHPLLSALQMNDSKTKEEEEEKEEEKEEEEEEEEEKKQPGVDEDEPERVCNKRQRPLSGPSIAAFFIGSKILPPSRPSTGRPYLDLFPFTLPQDSFACQVRLALSIAVDRHLKQTRYHDGAPCTDATSRHILGHDISQGCLDGTTGQDP